MLNFICLLYCLVHLKQTQNQHCTTRGRPLWSNSPGYNSKGPHPRKTLLIQNLRHGPPFPAQYTTHHARAEFKHIAIYLEVRSRFPSNISSVTTEPILKTDRQNHHQSAKLMRLNAMLFNKIDHDRNKSGQQNRHSPASSWKCNIHT